MANRLIAARDMLADLRDATKADRDLHGVLSLENERDAHVHSAYLSIIGALKLEASIRWHERVKEIA